MDFKYNGIEISYHLIGTLKYFVKNSTTTILVLSSEIYLHIQTMFFSSKHCSIYHLVKDDILCFEMCLYLSY